MKDKRSIPPKLRQFTSHLLRRAGDKAAELGTKHMKSACGLSTREWATLHLIHDQPQSQQAAADALGITPAQMVVIVDTLEKNGCLRRAVDPDDRRKHRLKITAKGTADYRAGIKALTTLNEELFSALKPEQLKALHDTLLKILE